GRLPPLSPLIPAVKQQDKEKYGDPIAQESEDRHRYRMQAHQDADGNDTDLHPRDSGQQKQGDVCPLFEGFDQHPQFFQAPPPPSFRLYMCLYLYTQYNICAVLSTVFLIKKGARGNAEITETVQVYGEQ